MYRTQPCRWIAVALAVLSLLQVQPLVGQTAYSDAQGNITIALAGDAIITRKLSVYSEPEFLALRDVIQGATAAFANLEMLLHDYGPDIIPASESGGTYMGGDPEMAKELAWMGFDMLSRANNHSLDYTIGGMDATTRAVKAAGLVQAGVGENLARARAPGYLETPGGRIALIAAASSFADHMRAGPQRKDVRGRPGLNPIRHRTTYVVSRAHLDVLKEIKERLHIGGAAERDRVSMMGVTFVVGDSEGVRTEPEDQDLAELKAAVADAKRQSNWVMVSSHSHEGAERREVPAQFVVTFARAMIDAGADLFVGHGPHVLRGIEIYKGKPIFYSLGDFIFQNETVPFQPAENYLDQGLPPDALPADFYDGRLKGMGGNWPEEYSEGVVAVPEFRNGKLYEIRIYPATLEHGLPRPQRGRPVLAKGEKARKIIGDLQQRSGPMGTRIDFVDGIGVIRAVAATQGR